jgi:hypothetical protein
MLATHHRSPMMNAPTSVAIQMRLRAFVDEWRSRLARRDS